MLKKLKIGTQLGIGFGLTLILLLTLALFSMQYMRMLADETAMLFNHPLTISNAVLKINTNVIKMHRTMKDIVLAGSTAAINKNNQIVDSLEKDVFSDFQIVSEHLIDDGQKLDYEEALRTFAGWKPIREEVVSLMREKKREEAADITRGKGARYVISIEEVTNKLADFAQDEARDHLASSRSVRSNAFQMMYAITGISVLAVIFLSLFIAGNITLPIQSLKQGVTNITDGNYDSRLEIKGESEIDNLASAFNIMAETLENSIRTKDRSEVELKASESRFRSIFESVMIGIFFWNVNGDITDANDAFLEIIGYTRDELVSGKVNWSDMTPPELSHLDDNGIYQLTERGVMTPYEKEYICKNGSRIPILIGASALPGPALNGVAFVIDITERKNTENSLIKRDRQLTESQKVAKLGSWDLDLVSQKLEWSDETYRLFDKDHLTFRPSFDEFAHLVHPDDLETMQTNFDNALKSDDMPYHVAVRIINESGREWMMEAIGKVRRDEDSKPLSIFGTAQDITKLKLAESDLRKKTIYLESILASSKELAIASVDLDFRITYYNQTAERIFGYKAEEVIGKTVMEMHTNEKVEPSRFDKAIEAVKKQGKYEYILEQINDGNTNIIASTVTGIWDRENQLIGFLLMSQDITKRKQAEEQIKSSLEEKEVLLREVHHRVKNNFQVITSLLNMQARTIKDESLLKIFTDSENRIKSMAFVHEMLYTSKDLSNIDFGTYIQTLTNSMFRSYRIVSDKVNINTDVKDITLDIGTAIPLGLVVNELVSNAMKHAFPGEMKGEIEISMEKTGNDDECRLVISDNGNGIPPEIDMKTDNTLGLRLVRNLIEKQLKGSIELVRDKGSKFIITCNLSCSNNA